MLKIVRIFINNSHEKDIICRGEIIIRSKTHIMVVALVAVFLMTAVGTVGAQEMSVAVVDTQEIFRIHPSFRDIQQKLQKKQSEMREELEGLGEEEAQKRRQEMQAELQELQQKLVTEAVGEVEKEVGNMAEELGFNVVLNPEGIIRGEEELAAEDITEDIITEMKEKYDIN